MLHGLYHFGAHWRRMLLIIRSDVVVNNGAQEADQEEPVELSRGEYTIDVDKSTITWVGRKIGTEHHGTIDIYQGSLSVDEEVFGKVIIDMTSIVNLDL